MSDPCREVIIDYTNWRGKRGLRRIIPTGIVKFESNEWHTETQWLIEAVDLNDPDHKIKSFSLNGIHSWAHAA
jgi:hypothetical protein